MNVNGTITDPKTAITEQVSGPVRPGGRVDQAAIASSSTARSHGRLTVGRDTDELFGEWLTRAQNYAANLRESVSNRAANPTMLSRLGQAELVAGNLDKARSAADQCLELALRLGTAHGAEGFDASSALAAIRLLLQIGQRSRAAYWLERVPQQPTFLRVRASISADEKKWDDALRYLEGIDTPEANSLRGYALLKKGEPRAALRELRKSSREENDADTLINMAFAFWSLGSQEKAISSAMQAAKKSPGRRDISFALIELLLAARKLNLAESEIAQLKRRDVVEVPAFLVLQAKVALAGGKHDRALALLRRASSTAKKSEETRLAAEIDADIASIVMFTSNDDDHEVKNKLLAKIRRDPDNYSLVRAFAQVCHRRNDAEELKKHVQRISTRYSDESLFFLRFKVAFLEFRFRDAARLACEWSREEYLDPRAITTAFLLHAQVTGDLTAAGDMAVDAVARFGSDALVVNNAAYILATAGRAKEAKKFIVQVSERPFYLVATAGLVELALGKVDNGLKLYRQAAELLDGVNESNALLALMRLHQVVSLHRLGIYEKTDTTELLAKSLPDVPPPTDWRELPDFVLLRRIMATNGWAWPWDDERSEQ